MDACLTVPELTFGYNSHPVIHHLNGKVRRGSVTAVVNANGPGKSTPMQGSCAIASGTSGAPCPSSSNVMQFIKERVE